MSDSHPAIKHWAELQGWPENSEIDKDHFAGVQQLRMVVSSPESRMKALHDIDAALTANDGTTLRAKSDLLRLRREMSKTHQALLRSGR